MEKNIGIEIYAGKVRKWKYLMRISNNILNAIVHIACTQVCILGQVANIDFFLHPFQGMFVEVFHDSCSKKNMGSTFFQSQYK